MAKKLKIRFVKFEKALAMQILEQEGSFRNSYHIQIGVPELCGDDVYLCEEDERDNLNHVSMLEFVSNELRDVYLNNVIRWISEEQFNGGMRELKVDEMCEVRDYEDDTWLKRRLVRILPEEHSCRYITNSLEPHRYLGYEYARPITKRTEPKIDGDIYTWEEK